jgi:hypothetical protein
MVYEKVSVTAEFILNYANTRGNLIFEKNIKNDTVLIIDFYNVYCNLIKFNKYKIFTKDTIFLCMKKITDNVHKDQKVFIVSKDIFELSHENKIELCMLYKNITFVLVKDDHPRKSCNKERDDYACILFQNIMKDNNVTNVIISNDKFDNYNELIKDIKPFTLTVYKNMNNECVWSEHSILKEMLEENQKELKESKIKKLNFTYKFIKRY